MPQHPLITFRHLLREVNSQFTKLNKNPLWRNELFRAFRQKGYVKNDAKKEQLLRDAQNVLTFLESNRKFRELLDKANPTHKQSVQERVEMTAHRVGLELPKVYNEA
ncbi:hypothetical protein G9A89_000064 [Geosiphon pyriformis]|nr:hypothetical protein G9A89_000064 [Geosiphon pyriformis]